MKETNVQGIKEFHHNSAQVLTEELKGQNLP